MDVKAIKRMIGIRMNKSAFRPLFERANLLVFHWHDRMYVSHPGNDEKKVLIIRPQTNTQGLLSTYLYVLKYVRWAEKNGYAAFVEFENELCQYYTGRIIQGSRNAWEYYFEQPSKISYKEVGLANTVLYSGWTILKKNRPDPIPKIPESGENEDIIRIAHEQCAVKPYVKEMAEKKYSELFSGSVLGVFLRGTDYIKMKPKGHAIQPSIDQVIQKIDEFLNQYNDIEKIFVVTEDDHYFRILKSRYGDKVFSSDDYFVKDYKGDKYVGAAFTNDAYERGLNYLIRILLFGKCDYTIAGITNGSIVASILKERKPKDAYWFNLGLY